MPGAAERRPGVPRPLVGRVVAVTGAGNGIGQQIAIRLVEAGARVALGDLDGAAARRAAAVLGGAAVGLDLDVTDTRSYTRFLDETERLLGPIDVLVANAGVMWVGPHADEPEAAAARQIEVNLLGVIRGVKLAGPRMTARGHGHLVAIASAASKLSPPGEATYAATKHGVYGYLKAVRAELRRSGVLVSAVMPGVVETELAHGTRTGPIRRLQPEEVAEAVVQVLLKPRFEVVVPARIGLLATLTPLLPQRIRDLVLRIALPNQVAAVRTGTARTEYENRHFTDRSAR